MCRLLPFLFLLPALFGAAQTPSFRSHSLKKLSDVQLTVWYQDNRGWTWLGAQQGLFRYDGLTMQPVRLPDSLANTAVSAMYEHEGMLWIGFRNGALARVPVQGTFSPVMVGGSSPTETPVLVQPWTPEEGTPGKAITAIAADRQGGLWFSTYGEGVYCYREGRMYQFDSADDGLAGDDIYSLAVDARNRVWVATDGGINLCMLGENGRKTVDHLSTADGLPDEIVTALLADFHGNVWVGTYEHGVCHYDVGDSRFDFYTRGWPYGPVNCLASFGAAQLWAGTEAHGPILVEPAANVVLPLPDGHDLRRVRVQALGKDREGWLWMVAATKEQLYSANIRFGMLDLPLQSVQVVCADHRGFMWIGNPDGLYITRRDGTGLRQLLPGRQNVLSLYEAPDGTMWVGTFGNGVFVLNPDGRVLRHITEADGLANGSVLSIDGNGATVWLATLGGVSTAVNGYTGRLQSFTHQGALGTSYVYKVFVDRRGRAWFGTDGKGLTLYDNGTFSHFTDADGHPLRTVYSIAEDRDGRLWFGTDRDGLFSYDGTRFRHYTPADHLHSQKITGLTAEAGGQLLIAYEDGFDLLNPETGHVAFLDPVSGVPTVDVNLNALCRDSRGNVWIGAREGVLRYAAIGENFIIDPLPGLVGVSVFLQPIDFLTDTIFEYDQNYFIFNFAGLWYTNPEAVRYRYRLEGFDPDWKVSKDPFASYPNLPPGSYVFRVQTSEHGAFENVPETTWRFSILRPFWQRWWFIALCLAGAGGLLYGWIYNREARLHREARLRREKIESEFAVLKSQINPHFLFNSFNTLITIIEESPGLAVEYVEHLSDFYRSVLVYREKDLISLQEEMALVRNFTFLLQKRYEDNFRLVEHVNGYTGLLMPLSLQLLVENAVKHNIISRQKPLTVEIFIEDRDYIVVRNNVQRKIKPEAGTHFGLQSLLHRYELLGERPVVVEEKDGYFTVKVPLL